MSLLLLAVVMRVQPLPHWGVNRMSAIDSSILTALTATTFTARAAGRSPWEFRSTDSKNANQDQDMVAIICGFWIPFPSVFGMEEGCGKRIARDWTAG